MQLFPVFLDLSEKKVMVIGKSDRVRAVLDSLMPCTGHISALLAAECQADEYAQKGIRILKKMYEREDLYGMDLVISTLDRGPENDDIFAACRTLGIPVILTMEEGRSDFRLGCAGTSGIQPDDSAGTSNIQPDNNAGTSGASSAVSPGPAGQAAFTDAGAPSHADAPGLTGKTSPATMHVTVYTDGAARGNPNGPGGYGAVLEFVDSKGQLHTKELSQGYVKTTNNRMELMGAIAALEALAKPCRVDLWSDSQYLVNAFTQNWIDGWKKKNWMRSGNEPVKNADLWKRLLEACDPHDITWHWVRGHNGHEQNERCDHLATTAADGDDLIPDPGVSVQ